MGKKSSKSLKIREHKSKKVQQNLRMTGILMMVASVFMITVPFMYRGTYNYIANNTTMPRVNDVVTGGIVAGVIFSLIYCLLGLFVFKAGEEGTFITKGLTLMNNAVLIMAIIATVFMFLPIPDQTFSYAVEFYSTTKRLSLSMVSMGILTILDMACIIGLTGAVAVIDDICVFKKGK